MRPGDRATLLGLLSTLALVAPACGKRADPLPPFPHVPLPLLSFQVSQRGDHVEVTYTAPRATKIGDRLGIMEVTLRRDDSMFWDFPKVAKKTVQKVAPGEVISFQEPLPLAGTLLRFQATVSYRGQNAPPSELIHLRIQPDICVPTALKGTLDPLGRGVNLAWTAPSPMPSAVPPTAALVAPVKLLPPNLFGPSPSPGASPGGSPSPRASPGEGAPSPPGGESPTPGALGPPAPGLPSPTATQLPVPAPSRVEPRAAEPPPASSPKPPEPVAPAPTPAPGESPAPSPPAGAQASPGSAPSPGASPSPGVPRPPSPPPVRSGFYVYRRAPQGTFARIGSFLSLPTLLDTAVKPGESWCYVVRTVVSLQPLIESVDSNEVCVEARDLIPPEPPAGLTVLAGNGPQLVLTWSPSREDDLALYRLYRSSEGAPAVRLAEIKKPGTTYTDTNVKSGVPYRYTLTAVDTSGNESKPSIPADGKLP